ncbi:MAG: PD-(D/E)XK nuclease family protein [Steroidobacteraceae bacterium]
MGRTSFDRRQLSRSKLDLFLECPRCFYEDLVRRNGRPGGPPFTLNIAVDELFKREFDAHRARQEPHPLFATVGLDAVPLQDSRLPQWRHNFTGVRWLDPDTGWTLYGAVDDLWLGADGRVMVADYKATSKAEHVTSATLHPAYRRQADVYQFLVAQQGLEVSDRAWFVYANGLKTADGFHDTLRFDTRLVAYDGDRTWVADAFREAVSLALSGQLPDPGPECAWCTFAAAWTVR